MYVLLRLFCFVICFSFTGNLFAEKHPYHLVINKSGGLPSNEVYDICEDDKGFVWLATGSGLYRYDGFSFVAWQSEAQTSASGSCIRKDRYGRIWYENFDGFLYYTDGKALKPLRQERSKAFMPFGITNKYLFVAQPEGVDVFDIKGLHKVKTIPLNLTRLEHATCANGAYYIAANGIVHKIDSNLKRSSCVLADRGTVSVHQLFAIEDSVYIAPRLSGANVVVVLDKHLQPVRHFKVTTSGYIRGIEKIAGDIWLYASLGAKILASGEGGTEGKYFDGKSISKILRDRNGNYWFGTTNEGIQIVPSLRSMVYKHNNTKIRQIATTGNQVLCGTYTGELLQLQYQQGYMYELSKDKHGSEVYYLYADEQNIIYSATGHTILSGEKHNEIKVADIAIKSIVPVDQKYYAVAASGMCLLLPRSAASYHMASAWDNKASTSRHYGISGAYTLLDGVRARSVAYNNLSHTIYFATNSGIVAVDTNGNRQLSYKGRPVYAAELVTFNDMIYLVDTKGKLLSIDRKGNIAPLDQLQQIGASKLLKVSKGKLYYCSGRQLFQYDGHTAQPMNIRIDVDEINDFAVTDSCLWLATNAGLVSFTSGKNEKASHVPPFYINSITVNETETDSAGIQHLSFAQNSIAINYSLVEFAAPIPSTVTYKINNGQWKELPMNTRTLHFRSLSPGQYIIHFAINSKETARQVAFNIAAPFWQQLWFYVAGVLVALLILLAYYSFRMKKRMRNAEQQKEKLLLEERLSRSMLTALRSQMNPHFFFNALNTVQAYIFTNERSKASTYLAKLSMLTRTILEMSETETVMLNDEVEALNLYLELECTRFGDDLKYQIITEQNIETATIEIPSMIIQPFVENAMKHGLLHKEGEKILTIHFAKQGNNLEIVIDDNGIGRVRSQLLNEIKNRKHTSYATRATAERVKLLNANDPGRIFVDITDKYNPAGTATGTTVTIKIRLA